MTRCGTPIERPRTFDAVLSQLSCRSAKDCRPARRAHGGMIQHVVGSAGGFEGSRERATAVRSCGGVGVGGSLPGALSAATGAGRRAERASMAAVSSKTLGAAKNKPVNTLHPGPPWQRGACHGIVIREGGWECRDRAVRHVAPRSFACMLLAHNYHSSVPLSDARSSFVRPGPSIRYLKS